MRRGIARGHVELAPGVRGGDVNGRVLPHRALGAGEPADAEAVHLHQLAGMIDVDVALGLRLRAGGWRGIQLVRRSHSIRRRHQLTLSFPKPN